MAAKDKTKRFVTMVNQDETKPVLGFGHGDFDYECEADGTFEMSPAHIALARSHGLMLVGEKPPAPPKSAVETNAELDKLRVENADFRTRLEVLEGKKK